MSWIYNFRQCQFKLLAFDRANGICDWLPPERITIWVNAKWSCSQVFSKLSEPPSLVPPSPKAPPSQNVFIPVAFCLDLSSLVLDTPL